MTDLHAMQDEILDELLGDFLDESTGLLAQLNEKLLALDAWAKNEAASAEAPPVDVLNEMFRAAHSLKGLSGMLRLTEINHLTHKVENVFDAARNAQLPVTTECIDAIFPAIDCISALVDALRQPNGDSIEIDGVIENIEKLLARNNALAAIGDQKDVERQLAELQLEAAAAVEQSPASPSPVQEDPLASVRDDEDVPARYLAIYLDESTLTLDELTETLLAADSASIESLLGLCHRLKGSSASIGLHRPAKLAHLMEDFLQEARRQSQSLPAGVGDLLLECVDALRLYVGAIKEGKSQPDQLSAAAAKLTCSKMCETVQEPAPVMVAAVDSGTKEAEIAACIAAAPQGISGVVGYVRFDAGIPLPECKTQLLFHRIDQIGHLFHRWISEVESEAAGTGLEVVFGVQTDLPISEIEPRILLEGVEAAEFRPIGEQKNTHSTEKSVEQSPSVAIPSCEHTSPATVTPSLERTAPFSSPSVNAAVEQKTKPTETLRVDIERLDQLMNLAGQLVINRARFGQISEGLKTLTSFRTLTHSLANAQHHAERISQTLEEANRAGNLATDALADLAQKMHNDLQSMQRDMAQLAQIRTMVASLSDAVHQLDRVSDGIQSTVMETRMVPIGPLFTRFKRVIRDLSRDIRKDIRLEIRGENTELDKRMIDELSDPLIHLVRNSVDHGIESAEERIAAGKPAQGVVQLNAFHRGNRIIIEVVDDGRGLDVDRIRAKGIAKGLITEAEAEGMTTAQIHALIWRPGFSTAEKITEVSGRGMGMDIVWSKIESLNGVVEVTSEKGKGCTFSIKLPLTMAILPSLLSVIGDDVFAIPVESVTEIVRVRGSELATVQGRSVLRVRGRVISVVELEEVMEEGRASRQKTPYSECDSITMVIVGADSREIAIVVDRLIGEQDVVIQSLAENFQNVDGLAGASILGDGRISLILDVPALLEKASKLARVIPVGVEA